MRNEEIGASVKSGQSVDNPKQKLKALRASALFLTSDFTDFTNGGIVVIYRGLFGFHPGAERPRVGSVSAFSPLTRQMGKNRLAFGEGGSIGALNAPDANELN